MGKDHSSPDERIRLIWQAKERASTERSLRDFVKKMDEDSKKVVQFRPRPDGK